MRTCILVLLVVATLPAYSQKKSKVDPKDTKIDSLTTANAHLTANLDSVSKEGVRYKSMHAAIRDKVLKYDFAPERTGELIDSLKTARDKTFSTLSADAKALNDSVTVLAGQNAELKAKVATLESAAANKEVVIADLRELKGLLDEKIITQEEFDTRKAKIMKGW